MANKIYEVEFSEEGLTKLITKYARLSKLFESKEFKEYLLEKCKKARDQIMLDKDIAHIEEVMYLATTKKLMATPFCFTIIHI